MTPMNRSGSSLPRHIETSAEAARAGRMSRREFLALATTFGATTATAYGLIGLPMPAEASGSTTPVRGGTLRIGMNVLALKDPRTADWNEIANVTRQFLEPLVKYTSDFTFEPRLLEGWEVNEDATEYVLRIRDNAVWNNGDQFTVEDVIFNLERWCDGDTPGNSMAARMQSLSSGGRLRDGAVEILDDRTIKLNLSAPDISLIANFADYPALIAHPSLADVGGDITARPIGTGPFELITHEVGTRSRLERRKDGRWWGGEALLDAVEFIDFGTDPVGILTAFDSGDIDMNTETSQSFVEPLDALGLVRNEVATASTVVARMNVGQAPYQDARIRRAIQMAVDPAPVMELGVAGYGTIAENHHVGPMHPEYAELPPQKRDPAAAIVLLEEAGMRDHEFDLISLDAGYRKDTADAIAAQLRDAGIRVKRTIIPGNTFWNDWTEYPFSLTSWNGRPLGVQVYALAYRSGEAWNESAFSDPVFDEKLSEALSIADPDARRVIMADLQKILQDSGILIQPYWNKSFTHSTERVKGYRAHPTAEIDLGAVWLDG